MTVCEGINVLNNAGFEVIPQDIKKPYGEILTGYGIRKKGSANGLVPTVYEGFFANASTGDQLVEMVEKVMWDEESKSSKTVLQLIHDYEKIRPYLRIKLMKQTLIDEFISQDFLNMKLLAYIDLTNIVPNGTVTVNYGMLDQWNKTADEVFEDAMLTADKDFSVFPMKSFVDELLARQGQEPCDLSYDADNKMYIITNKRQLFGATAIMDGDWLRSITGGKNAVILPSSIHELILIPGNYTEEQCHDFREIVKSVNHSTVALEDRLSDDVYLFDGETGELRIA